MTEALRFLALAELIGLAALPLTAHLFGRLPGDGGLAFAKLVGLLAVGWVVWLLASLHLVPYGVPSVVGALVALAAAGAWTWRRFGVPGNRRVFWWGEWVFLASFVMAALVTAYSPDVWNTEKPMDMAFINAVNRSEHFPPHDPWLAGAELNYYYFGHFLLAMFVRLTGVEPSAGYNVSIALVFALSVTAAFAFGAALWAAARELGARSRRGPVFAGLLAAYLTMIAGTLQSGLHFLDDDRPLAAYDWFGLSRVIGESGETINEFPIFSFNLGDLHAHVLALPFTLLALGLLLQLALVGVRLVPRWPAIGELVACALAVGALYAINTWSYPVLAGLALVALAIGARPGRPVAVWAVSFLALSVLLMLPFHLSFDPAARGLGRVREHAGFSQFYGDHVLVYGVFLYALALLFLSRIPSTQRPWRNVVWGGAALLFCGSLLAERDALGVAVLALAVGVAIVALARSNLGPVARFSWLLVFGGFTCLLVPELVYVRDSFDNGPLYRMNTVFKMGYQAWVLLALGAAAAILLARETVPKWPRRAWLVGLVPLLVLAAGYAYAGTYARKQAFNDGPRLFGLRWLERTAPGDVPAMEWLRENADGKAVVLESAGDDYSAFGHARISTFTGNPTVVGWGGHEVQWEHDPGARRQEVDRMYREREAGAVRALLERYDVSYVVVGPIERTDHGDAGVAKWDVLGRKVFDRDGTTVWKLR